HRSAPSLQEPEPAGDVARGESAAAGFDGFLPVSTVSTVFAVSAVFHFLLRKKNSRAQLWQGARTPRIQYVERRGGRRRANRAVTRCRTFSSSALVRPLVLP